MTPIFEELDYQETPLGNISLRRRSEPVLQDMIVYEVKLNDEFLMASLFTASEVALSRLGLAVFDGRDDSQRLDVVVGGLGLGYTAAAALQNPSVASLIVVDVMAPVIDWHRNGIVPLGKELTSDARCTLVLDDFFELATSNHNGFYREHPDRLAHAVLLDIDHTPSEWLNPGNSTFYSQTGLKSVADKLHSGGVFGVWSNDPPDDAFTSLLNKVFASSEFHVVTFANPYTGGESSNTVYLAHKA